MARENSILARARVLLPLALIGCQVPPARPLPPTEAAAATAPELGACAGVSIFAVPRESWHHPASEPMACEPAPGRAGWVAADDKKPRERTEVAREAPPPLELPPPVIAVVVAGAGHSLDAREQARLAAMSGPDAIVRGFDGATVSEPQLRAELEALGRRSSPTTHLRLLVRGPTQGAGPWGCVPLADECVPQLQLQEWLAQQKSASRAVIVEDGEPARDFALWADGGTTVAAFAKSAAGTAAARKFWAAEGDADGDGVVALRERFVAAAAREPAALFIDPPGTTAWASNKAQPRLPAEVAVADDPAALKRLTGTMQSGEWLLVYLADVECVECKLNAYRDFTRMVNQHRGLRFAKLNGARAFLQAHGRVPSPIEPTIAYYDSRGRLVGFADDHLRAISALPPALLPADRRRVAYESLLAGQNVERAAFAAAALIELDGGGEGPLLRLARRIHQNHESALVIAVLTALARGKWLGTAAIPEVVSHLDHPDIRVRQVALDTLFALETTADAVLCPIVSAIPDPDPGFRERVRKLLFIFLRDVEAGVPAMTKLLLHSDAAVRRAAVEAFAGLNAGERAAYALPELVHIYLSESTVEVRRQALLAIAHLGPAAAPALIDLSQHLVGEPDEESRALLAEILGNIGAPATCAKDGLELLAREDVPMVRRKADEALERLQPAT